MMVSKKKNTILIVAFTNSIHTVRWINHVKNLGMNIILFSSNNSGLIHPELDDITVVQKFYYVKNKRNLKCKGLRLPSEKLILVMKAVVKKGILKKEIKSFNLSSVKLLEKTIKKYNPDIIHSLEMQSGAYLVYETKKRFQGAFPRWIVTNWGSDIYLFGRLKEHKNKIREVLASCDYYSCECNRDVSLAKEFGFQGTVLPVMPNSGGIHIDKVSQWRQQGPTSGRRIIAIKGYQGWAGRCLTGIRALAKCADLIRGYKIVIYSATDEGVFISAELLGNISSCSVEVLPLNTPHEEILKLHGHSRISIGLSISDGLSTSLLEAITMGSFPIQSYTAGTEGWIEDGVTGLLVSPEDSDSVEGALRKALKDDRLVDEAAKINYETAKKKLDYDVLNGKVKNFYEIVLGEGYNE